MGLALSVLAWRSWAGMPLPARALTVLLAPALLALSTWPRPWTRMVKFMADERGAYFPANELLMLSFRPATGPSWLHVPWKNISNIRPAREVGEDGQCVAFELVATPSEVAAFFKHVGKPRDDTIESAKSLCLAYGDSPPRPATTVQLLESFKARSECN